MTPMPQSNNNFLPKEWLDKATDKSKFFAQVYGGGPTGSVSTAKNFGKIKTLMGKTLDQLANGESVIVFGSITGDMASDIKQWAKHHGFTAHFMMMATKTPSYKVWLTQDENATMKAFDIDLNAIITSESYLAQSIKTNFNGVSEYIQMLNSMYSVPPANVSNDVPSWATHNTALNQSVPLPKECTYCGFDTEIQPVLHSLIQHLNDRHRWTYEKIADWLDTLENQPVFYPKIEEEEKKKYSSCSHDDCNNPTFDEFCYMHDNSKGNNHV